MAFTRLWRDGQDWQQRIFLVHASYALLGSESVPALTLAEKELLVRLSKLIEVSGPHEFLMLPATRLFFFAERVPAARLQLVHLIFQIVLFIIVAIVTIRAAGCFTLVRDLGYLLDNGLLSASDFLQ